MTIDRMLVYTAQSKNYFYCRDAVCQFVFESEAIPLNPFRAFDYFLSDRVNRDAVREGNRKLIQVSDEMWVFGQALADGVILEIALATRLRKPIRYFTIDNRASHIKAIAADQLTVETEVLTETGLDEPQIRRHIVDESPDPVITALGRMRELSGI